VSLVFWFGIGLNGVTVSLARIDPALNGYLDKYREGKQKGYANMPIEICPNPPLNFLAEGT